MAQSVMLATDMLGHWDVCGLSAIDPRPRQWISAQGCWHAVITGVGNCPHMSVLGNNTAPINNDDIARLSLMVWSQVQVPTRADVRHTDHVQWGSPDSK